MANPLISRENWTKRAKHVDLEWQEKSTIKHIAILAPFRAINSTAWVSKEFNSFDIFSKGYWMMEM